MPKPPPIRVPSRFLWGGGDPILSAAWADWLNEYFADMRLDIAADAGHFVHYEWPDLTNAEIAAFFEGLPG